MSKQVNPSNNQAEDQPSAESKSNLPTALIDKLLARLSIARERLVDRNLRNRLISTNLNSSRTKNIRFTNVNSESIFTTLHKIKSDMSFSALGEVQEGDLIEAEEAPAEPVFEANQLYTRLEKESLQKKLKSLYFEAQE